MFTCGNCRGQHETADEARACYGNKITADKLTRWHDGRDGQYELLQKLLDERDMSPLPAYAECQLTKNQASQMITHLIKDVPRTPPSEMTMRNIDRMDRGRIFALEAGFYATKSRTGNNDIDFFEVDKPTEGKWAGYTFVKRVIGGRASVNIRGSEANSVLQAIIDMGAEESGMLFARELRRCRFCKRHLTKYASRALSCGPDCAQRRGFGGLWANIQAEWEAIHGKDAEVPDEVEQIKVSEFVAS